MAFILGKHAVLHNFARSYSYMGKDMPKLLYYLKKNQRIQGPVKPPRRFELSNWNHASELSALSQRLNLYCDPLHLKSIILHPTFIGLECEKSAKILDELNIINPDSSMFIELHKTGKNFLEALTMMYLRYTFVDCPEEILISIKEEILSLHNTAKLAKMCGLRDLVLSQDIPDNAILSETLFALFGCIISNNSTFEMDQTFGDITVNPQSNNIVNAMCLAIDIVFTQLIALDPFEFWDFCHALTLCESILAKDLNLDYIKNNNSNDQIIEARLIRLNGINTIYPLYMVGLYHNQKFISQGFGETLEIATDQAARQWLKQRFGFHQINMGACLNFRYNDIVPPMLISLRNELLLTSNETPKSFLPSNCELDLTIIPDENGDSKLKLYHNNSNYNLLQAHKSIRDYMSFLVDIKPITIDADGQNVCKRKLTQDNPITGTHDEKMYEIL